ncbi:MAG: PucR family transcriptional regulator, partial [Bacteroidota bacterium]
MQANLYSSESPIPALRVPPSQTGLTISTVLTLPEYSNARLVGGASGIDRKVSAAVSLEGPHATWLRGGELVITAGQVIESWANFLEKLNKAGAAGCVVALGPYHAEMPLEAIQAAEPLNLPLIGLPFAGELTTPVQAVNLAICMAKTAYLRRSVELERQLVQLVLDGAGIEEVLRLLSTQAGLPILLEDRQFNLIASAPAIEEHALFNQVVAANGTPVAILKEMEDEGSLKRLRSEKVPFDSPERLILPVVVGGEIFGYLSAFGKREEEARMVVENACSAIAIELLKQRGISESDQKARRDFFRDLLYSHGNISPETLHRRATYLGYQLSSSYWSIVVEFDSVPNEELLPDEVKRLSSILNSLLSFRQALVINQTQGATILYPVKENQPTVEKVKHLCETIRQKIATTLPDQTVSIGIGQLYHDLLSIPKSFREAQHAVKIGRALNGINTVNCFSEL